MAVIKKRAMLAAYALLGIVPRAHADDTDVSDDNWNMLEWTNDRPVE